MRSLLWFHGLYGLDHGVITVIEEQRPFVLGSTALFTKVGLLHIHMIGKRGGERRWTIIALRNLIFYFWSNIELTWHEYSFMSQITTYKEKM